MKIYTRTEGAGSYTNPMAFYICAKTSCSLVTVSDNIASGYEKIGFGT